MRHSQFTDTEILHLVREADAGVPVDEICRTAGVSLRTFYRWRRRFGGLSVPAVERMKELQAENLRLRLLVSNLSERLHDAPSSDGRSSPVLSDPVRLPPGRASVLAAERCGGAVVGRFASVRGTR
ncbi:transposase [Ancylobacter sp. SL191]|uniref:transposase n=1 Tax=Ancylobacter sp. SL191 TaxID=2995166 RepID=UPI002271A50E|nr:transposase [Ancylobacter sp. SL191]WAC25639.1 transposase [Ancylobacter sp. SL191]